MKTIEEMLEDTGRLHGDDTFHATKEEVIELINLARVEVLKELESRWEQKLPTWGITALKEFTSELIKEI